MAEHSGERQCKERQRSSYEVNCCAAALRSTDRQGEGKALIGLAMEWQSEGMAKKSEDVICEGKAVHRNDSLRKGFASDALAQK